ncbi:inositol monophosphatase 1-like [Tigriopus californicus]|uniref:inositol monophosphatase 1-like n=1 Tax=Tigriopus californicus TaxID=6832 RepID=UPI0027D9F76E|nr:inositol monophosphatase 1-like [Tigriopus californicus]
MAAGEEKVTLTAPEMDAIYETISDLVQQAGQKIRQFIRESKAVEEKLSRTDLVTQTDKDVEELLIRGILAKYPDHEFIGEEGTAARDGNIPKFSNKPTWIIDPIDGTMNFVHSNPNVSVSVALAVNRHVEIGIIYLPATNQLYTARKGQGARFNDSPVRVSKCNKLANSMVIYELWASSGSEIERDQLNVLAELMPQVHAIRSIGEYIHIVKDILSNVVEFLASCVLRSHPTCTSTTWELLLFHKKVPLKFNSNLIIVRIVKEAGGIVLDPSGGEFDFMSRRILAAATPELAQQVVDMKLSQQEHPREFDDVCLM